MKSFKIFFLYVGVLCAFTTFASIQPSLLELTQDQLLELNKQIEDQVNKMSPEEKSKFYKQVAEEQEKMSKMNQQELVTYIEKIDRQVFGGEPVEVEQPASIPAPMAYEPLPAPMIEEPAESEAPSAPIVEQKTVETARVMLDEIVQRIDYIIIRADAVNNMAMRISRWGNQNKLNPWTGIKWDTNAWHSIRAAIQTLKQKLHKIKDNKHLGDFIEDKEFYTHLEQLHDQLEEYEPKFILDEGFGAEQLSKQSYRAFRKILNTLQYSIYVYDFNKSIDRLEEKYAPRAAKLKGEEVKKAEQALEEAKKPIKAAPTQIAGSSTSGYNPPTYSTESGYQPYYPSYSDSNYGYSGYDTPSYNDYGNSSYGGGSSRGGGGSGASGSKASGDSSPEKEKADGQKKKNNEANAKKNKDEQEKSKNTASEELKKVSNSLQSAEEAVVGLDEMPARINSLSAPVNNADIRNSNLAISRLKIVKNRVNNLKLAEKDAATRIKYGNDLASQIADFNNLAGALRPLTSAKGRLAPEKQYAFFGGDADDQAAALKANPQAAGQITETTDIRKLVKQIEELNKAVESLKS